jgi:hypothetical protein
MPKLFDSRRPPTEGRTRGLEVTGVDPAGGS